jgi:hypothetical protein
VTLRETPLQIIDKPILPLQRTFLGEKPKNYYGQVLAGFFICIFLLVKDTLQD